MAAVRHLGFVTSWYLTTHEVFSLGHIGLSNFVLIRCTVLKIWRFEFFADLAWNAYSRPQNFVFWGIWTLNVIGHHRDPQKAPPWPKPHLHANFGVDRSTGATCAWAEGIKKKKKRQEKKLLSGAVFPLTLTCGLYNSLYYRTSRLGPGTRSRRKVMKPAQ